MTWIIVEKKLVRQYELKSFNSIVKKLTELSKVADKMEHHPDFEVYDYNKIRFSLFTHSSNSITAIDYKLAEEIDVIFK